jgi:hypothetical protein
VVIGPSYKTKGQKTEDIPVSVTCITVASLLSNEEYGGSSFGVFWGFF